MKDALPNARTKSVIEIATIATMSSKGKDHMKWREVKESKRERARERETEKERDRQNKANSHAEETGDRQRKEIKK